VNRHIGERDSPQIGSVAYAMIPDERVSALRFTEEEIHVGRKELVLCNQRKCHSRCPVTLSAAKGLCISFLRQNAGMLRLCLSEMKRILRFAQDDSVRLGCVTHLG